MTTQNDFSIRLETGKIEHNILVGGEYYRDRFDRRSAAETAPEGSNSRYYVRLPSPYDFITREWSVETTFLNPIGDWAPSPRPEDLQAPSVSNNVETEGEAYYLINQMVMMEEALRVVAGVRYETYDSKDFLTTRTGSESDIVYQGGAMYNFSDAWSIFASYSESFYRNEFYARSADPTLVGSLAPPQEGEGIDIGLKWETADGKFAGTFAFFDLSQSSILVNTQVNGVPDQILAGERTSKGVELDMHYAPRENWQVIFNYAYIDAEDVETGMEMPNVPEHQASVWTRYEFIEGSFEGLFLGGGARYLGDRPGGTDANVFEQSWEFDAEGYVNVDFFAGKSFSAGEIEYEVQLSISNVLDEEFTRGGQTLVGEPRRYNMAVKMMW